MLSDAEKRKNSTMEKPYIQTEGTEANNDIKNHFSLDGIDGYMFEELIAKIMGRAGFTNIHVTQKSGDSGKDILMENANGDTVIVECKHQSSVGRPVIQKLQGAMTHESILRQNSKILGMIVTSGKFTNEAKEYANKISGLQKITLMDGKGLKQFCEQLGLIIINGKVQILSNKSYKNISVAESICFSKSGYSKIYGHDYFTPKIESEFNLHPLCFIDYQISFDTHTSVGIVDSHSNSGKILIDGVSGKFIRDQLFNFYTKDSDTAEEINNLYFPKIKQYEFTENELENRIFDHIIHNEKHIVRYVGGNNITYYKECIPTKKDIRINIKSLYAPIWSSNITFGQFLYSQKFAVNAQNKLFLSDDLLICKVCNEKHSDHSKLFLCHNCGKIVCKNHKKIDYLDKVTPVCEEHYKNIKVFFQKKYFAKEETKNKYREWLNNKNTFVKIYEDKYVFSFLLLVLLTIIAYQIPFSKYIDFYNEKNNVPIEAQADHQKNNIEKISTQKPL